MKRKKTYLCIGIIFLITCIVLSCLFFNIRYQGHDTVFHVSNIIRLSETISFNKIFGESIFRYEADNFSYGVFGYGIGLFYPRMPHLIASYIYLLCDNIYFSMNIVYFITTLLSGIFTYFLAEKIYKNQKISLISSLIYITVPYHICEIYIRDAFAENFMFMVLPMIFLGLYNLKEDNYIRFYILFILGYIIGINSHLVSMLFYTFIVGVFILYYRKEFFKKEKFVALVKSTLIVTLMVLPSLITLLEHKSLGIYRVFTDTFAEVDDIFILKFKDLFTQKMIYDDIMPYFNISSVILFGLTTIGLLFFKKDKNKDDKKIFLIIIFILINLMCSNVIWDNVPRILLSIQFPWRLMVMMSLMISLYVPGIFSNNIFNNLFKNNGSRYLKYIFAICYIGLFLLIIYEGFGNIKYHKDNEVDPDDAITSVLGLGYSKEYFPQINYSLEIFKHNYFPQREYVFESNKDIKIDIISDDFPNMEFEVSNIDSYTYIEIPRTFYLGYTLVNEHNEKIKLENSFNGLLNAVIKDNGVYKLSYDKTIAVKIAEVIRIITMFILGIVLVVKLVKWKRKRLQY